jgi:single-strand DNA-binding protein
MSNVRSLNRVILVGRVGREAENTTIASSGRELSKFPIVTNEGYFDQNSKAWKDLPPEWHSIVAWGPLAQKKINKGDMVLVEGKIKTRKWKDQSGQERKTTEIEASNIVVLDRKSKESSSGSTENFPPTPTGGARTFSHTTSPEEQPPPFDELTDNEDLGNEEDPF